MDSNEFVVYKGEKIPIIHGYVDLSCSNIKDLRDVEGLADCVNLGSIDISRNPLKEVRGLENLRNLGCVWARGCS